MSKSISITPESLFGKNPRQLEAWSSSWKHRFLLYGGAAGGGKSFFLRWWCFFYLYALSEFLGVKRAQVLLACEDYPSLIDRQVVKIESEFPPEMGRLSLGATREFTLAEQYGGGQILLRNLDDPSKYLSAEFAGIAVDELTRNEEKVFNWLRLRLRWPGVDKPRFVAGTNPGGKGHAWAKRYWIDGGLPRELASLKDEFAFVQAKAQDNPFLSETYYDDLQTLPANMRRAYAEGRWDLFAGQYFSNWEREKHVVSLEGVKMETWWRRWISFDWGYGHHASAHWHIQVGTLDDAGNSKRPLTVTYREYVTKGMSERALAEEIVARNQGDKIESIFAGHDLWKEDSTGSKESQMSSVFIANGMPKLKHAKIERVNGWRLMHLMLDEGEWLISDNCPHAIEAIPSAVHNEEKMEDVLKTTDLLDDVRDDLRYGIYSQYGPSELPFEQQLKRQVSHLEDATNRSIMLTKLISDRERAQKNRGQVNNRSAARSRRFG